MYPVLLEGQRAALLHPRQINLTTPEKTRS